MNYRMVTPFTVGRRRYYGYERQTSYGAWGVQGTFVALTVILP